MKKTQVWMFVALLLWVSLFFLQKTNLAASDLGRHIKNGEIILQTGRVFSNNLYSYTNPDFYAPNHHWLFGVISYLIYIISGFAGLTLMSAILYTSAVAISAWYSQKKATLYPAIIATIVALPLFAARSETRPEAFSLLFFTIIWWILSNWLEAKKTSWWMIAALITTMALWVNIHIFFILAIPLVGAAGLAQVIKKNWIRVRDLLLIAAGMLTGAFLNPLGLDLILYPFKIFSNYGYRVAENQPLWFFLQQFTQPIHWYLLVFLVLTIAALVYVWKTAKKFSIYQTILFIFFAGFTARLIRMENIFAIVSIPILAQALHIFWQKHHRILTQSFKKPEVLMPSSLAGFGVFAVLMSTRLLFPFDQSFGVGLYPGYAQSIAAVQQLPLNQPIFNNFDAGSFLIFTSYPEKKVFVDNRAEAYPDEFLQNVYIKAQEDDQTWQALLQQYNFQTIIYYRHDLTNWGQEFLVSRIQDVEWAPIYVDNFLIIFARNNDANKELIEKYRLPQEMFSYTN